ncbi:MAG: hypothetical protein Q4F40_07495, partial [Akkermansia sp.]|nr:hypothetical protein [Akkermansia sp.]
MVFTLRAAQSSPPCAARFFTAGFSPLFTRPQAVEKLDFEFWILKLNIRLASSQCSKLEFVEHLQSTIYNLQSAKLGG